MRNLLKLAAAVALLAGCMPAAQAQQGNYTFPERQIDSWLVYGYKDKCWMLQRNAVKNTTVSFAFRSDSKVLYIGAEDRSWTSLESEKRYDVRVEMGPVSGIMTGFGLQDTALGPMMGVFVTDDGGDYFKTLRRTDRLKLSIGGTTMVDLPMGGSGAAVDYFQQCARAVGVGPYAR